MNIRFFTVLVISSCWLIACSKEAPAPSGTNEQSVTTEENTSTETAAVEEVIPAVIKIAEDYYDEFLELNPLQATFIGDNRFNDRIANSIGPEYLAATLAMETKYLNIMRQIDAETLSGQERLSYDTFMLDRKNALKGFEYPSHLIPINQFWSYPNFFAQLGSGSSVQQFNTAEDYDNFLGRINDMETWMNQAIINMKEGVEKGAVQPRVIMEKVLPQLAAHVVTDPKDSLFYTPITNLPDTIAADKREAITERYTAAITEQVIPSYKALHDYIKDEYLASARDSVGLTELPNGVDWYNYLIATTTTTNLNAKEIHQIGLNEVKRIKLEMDKVREQVGFEGDLKAFLAYLKTDPQFYFKTEDELLNAYRARKSIVAENAPKLFSLMPKADFEIRAVEAFRAQSAAGASYMAASPDGSRPGVFYVNTYDLSARPNFEIESIFLHEAIPGHHFQIAIQQELEMLPRFRRYGGYTAYVEGWGLYAETLGKELGLYTDPYQQFGAYGAEILRAVRLVTDTGMHALGWTREEALQYMLDNSTASVTDATAEIERYIAIPSQALAYKLGQLKISDMREQLSQRLGDKFDVRAFHAQVIQDGALPLYVLERKINRWAESQ